MTVYPPVLPEIPPWLKGNTEATSITVPDDLAERDQWVLWRYEKRNDNQFANANKRTKVPYRVDGRKASSTNPKDGTGHEAVLRIFQRYPKHYSGIGFVFYADDPFVGIDLDDCLEGTTGHPKPWVQNLLARFNDTYIEISPSGLGLKIWCRGQLPANVGDTAVNDGAIALFDHAKYFTVTGQTFRGAPLEIEDHAADVLALYEAFNQGRGTRQAIPGDGKIRYRTQHLTLVKICGTLRRHGVCEEAIEACLQAVNRYQCERPGPARNIARIVRSTRSWSVR
jgi:primase-polymerase (primpol)-like protein